MLVSGLTGQRYTVGSCAGFPRTYVFCLPAVLCENVQFVWSAIRACSILSSLPFTGDGKYTGW